MSKKNLLSGRDKELQEMAEQYEAAKAENRTIYLDADDLADLADWYAVHHKYAMATEVVEYGLGIHPDNTALLVEQAYLFLDTQHKEQAKDILERIAEESSEVKVLKANLLLGEGKEEEAEAILDSIDDKDDLANIVDVSVHRHGIPGKSIDMADARTRKICRRRSLPCRHRRLLLCPGTV